MVTVQSVLLIPLKVNFGIQGSVVESFLADLQAGENLSKLHIVKDRSSRLQVFFE